MKAAKANAVNRPRTLFFILLLAVVLAALFCKSFLPGYVHFSNDGPLGQQNAAAARLPGGFTGYWGDLNVIGSGSIPWPLEISALMRWAMGPVGFAKFYAPVGLFILGLGAWTFFRQLRLAPLAAVLGGLAAALNSSFFSRACWGLAAHPIAVGMVFFALALIVSNTAQTPALTRWVRLALAGLAVGLNVMEAADIGAIFSLFVAAFVFYKALNEEGVPVLKKISGGVLRVAMVAMFAGFIALQTIVGLVGSEITGIVSTGQEPESRAHQWDFATQWSLPKKETFGFFVPGLFGYRMDTPRDMMTASLQDAYKGGEYWGGEGRSPAIDRYFDGGNQGAEPPGIMRFNGDGHYLGILIALLAAFAVAQSLRRENSPFTVTQKKFVWFWAAVLVVTLFFSWGRFAPFNLPAFYEWLYFKVPGLSSVRNSVKFILVFSWATVILSGFGVHVLSRRYLEVPAGKTNSFITQLLNWWTKVRGFDRKWTVTCVVAVAASLLGWFIYSTEKTSLIHYLEMVGFPDEGNMQGMAKEIAAFSIGQAGWFVLIFAVAAGFFTLILAGIFSGKRAKLGGILLGALMVMDLGRADLPFIYPQDYQEKYAGNPIIDLLKDKPYEHRVSSSLPFRIPDQFQIFEELYRIEWMQHHFPYYNIQSLDIVQMSRPPADWAAFENALASDNPDDAPRLIARRWQLTNTRYLLGPAGYLEALNTQIDPAQHRFRILQRFSIGLKPGVSEFHQRLEELTAIPSDNGDYALIEFTGALPRAKIYSNWQVSTNDDVTLKNLADKNFDPQQTVLVSDPLPAAPSTSGNSGTVEFKSYAPKDIVFDAKTDTASVLLLNDKYDPHWTVTVDGKPSELLRCNFIMRGVYLPPGAHTVEFYFSMLHRQIYVTLAAIVIGIFLLGLLRFLTRREQAQSPVG